MNTLFFTCEEIDLNPRASWAELLQITFVNKENSILNTMSKVT